MNVDKLSSSSKLTKTEMFRMHVENDARRAAVAAGADRIVVKVGTRLLTGQGRVKTLIGQISNLLEDGKNVILVTSGAVGMGMKTLGMRERPEKLSSVQALAAIGQIKLMAEYERECARRGFHSAQLLLTADDIRHRERHLNVLNCVHSLWGSGVLPIVNENDSVSIDELKFGDNDVLAGLLATMCRCDLTIILTTVDGVRDFRGGGEGRRIPIVEGIDDELRSLVSGTDDGAMSIGGMITKIRAAEIVTAAGEHAWIANGEDDRVIERVVQGEDVGTLFVPSGAKQMKSKKRWIGFFSPEKGTLVVDDGAVVALTRKGRSLLPSGIVAVEGRFKRGDTVSVAAENGKIIGRGLSNYGFKDVETIRGRQSGEIAGLLGVMTDEEVVHRDNLTIL